MGTDYTVNTATEDVIDLKIHFDPYVSTYSSTVYFNLYANGNPVWYSDSRQYFTLTKRRLTFEYILLEGINDNIDNAKQLIKLLKGLTCYVNLIPYNETYLNDFKRSKNVNEFCNFLNKNGLLATIRLERGASISAACGQLRIQQYDK